MFFKRYKRLYPPVLSGLSFPSPPPPPPAEKTAATLNTGGFRSRLTLIKEISCFQRACLSDMTLCLRKLPRSIVRTQEGLIDGVFEGGKTRVSAQATFIFNTPPPPPPRSQISFALKKYQPYFKKR